MPLKQYWYTKLSPKKALPVIEKRLKEKQVEIRGCQTVCRILPDAVPATEQDWATEYLGLYFGNSRCRRHSSSH